MTLALRIKALERRQACVRAEWANVPGSPAEMRCFIRREEEVMARVRRAAIRLMQTVAARYWREAGEPARAPAVLRSGARPEALAEEAKVAWAAREAARERVMVTDASRAGVTGPSAGPAA